jgi:Ca2+-binding RTX toxin-like protein
MTRLIIAHSFCPPNLLREILDMATSAQLTALKQLYTGIFGFLPTKGAFDWYTAQINRLGLDTAGLANVLLYDDTQAGASNTFDYSGGDAAFVRQVYQNLFGWSEEALTLAVHVEGVAYWTAQLNGVFGGDKGKLIETMIWVIEVNGPASPDASTRQAFTLLQNYVEVSTYALEQVAATGAELPPDTLRAAYDAVTDDRASADAAKGIISVYTKSGGIYTENGVLYGDNGNNALHRTGDIGRIEGGRGNDAYNFKRDDKFEILDDGGDDVILIEGGYIVPENVSVWLLWDDLYINFGRGGLDSITVRNQFVPGYEIETLKFHDRWAFDLSLVTEARAAGDLQEGMPYPLSTFYTGNPSGGDKIVDWLIFNAKQNLTGHIYTEADAVPTVGYFSDSDSFLIQGTPGNVNDIFTAWENVDAGTSFEAAGGYLHRWYGSGDDGNDLFIGGKGRNHFTGGYGNDILYGGKDDDVLIGGKGDNTFVFTRGDGKDEINPSLYYDNLEHYYYNGYDTILFDKEIGIQDIYLAGYEYNIILRYTSEDSVLLFQQRQRVDNADFTYGYGIDEIQFHDAGDRGYWPIDFVGVSSNLFAQIDAGVLEWGEEYPLSNFIGLGEWV